MLRCAITDGTAADFANTAHIERLQNQVRRWAVDGIDFIQLREKSLEPGELFALAEATLSTIRETNSSTRLLINGRADVAIAARADGVHLTSRSDEFTPEQVRTLFSHAGVPCPTIGLSCHTTDEILRARNGRPDYILFGPVFEKRVNGELVSEGAGLDALHRAAELAARVPVLALGGITLENALACMAAGAAGVAGIRTFL